MKKKMFSLMSMILFMMACSSPTPQGHTTKGNRILEPPPEPDSGALMLSSSRYDDIDPDGNFLLYVSNQSFAITPVDIIVKIDGKIIVNEMFEVGSQHRWKLFRIKLPKGKHEITASSKKGSATLHKLFTVKGKQWAVVDYWYYPPTHYDPCPRQLSFKIFDKQIYFQ